MSEFMGLIRGQYDAKAAGFLPGEDSGRIEREGAGIAPCYA